jgi:hypothetical protein
MKKYITTVSYIRVLVLFFMMTLSATVSAQTDLPDAPVDEPAAPIDGYVYVLAFLGLVYVFLRLRAFAKANTPQQ